MESNEILSLLAEHYKLKGSLIPLAGELDLNYKLTIDNETAFIVKISRDPETISSIAFQEALLRHLKEKEIEGEVPQLIPNLSGTYQKEVFLPYFCYTSPIIFNFPHNRFYKNFIIKY